MRKIISEDVLAFKKRSSEAKYSVIFTDATHISLKRQTVSKEVVCIVVGIRLDWREPKRFLKLTLFQSNLRMQCFNLNNGMVFSVYT